MQGTPLRALRPWVAACLLVAAAGVQAQTVYRCQKDNRSVLSDKPCTTGAATSLNYYGPVNESSPRYTSSMQVPTRKAADYLAYLTPACAELNEAIRTAPSRGVRGQGLRDLHEEYQRDCRVDDRLAQRRLAREQDAKDVAEIQARERQAKAAHDAQQQAQLVRSQCAEMRGFIADRKQRLSGMSEGEQADLRRAEERFKQRCVGA